MARQIVSINEFYQRSLRGEAFFGANVLGPVASNYSHVQLLNPAGTGKNVIITSISVRSTSADFVELRSYATALTTNENTTNKLIGGSAASGQLHTEAHTARYGTLLSETRGEATTNFRLILSEEPIVLAPATGILVVPAVVNVGLEATYEWLEVDA